MSTCFAIFLKILKLAIFFAKILANFGKNVVLERCEGVHCVDLGESFPTHIYVQNLASIQSRTSSPKFAEASKRYPPPVINLALQNVCAASSEDTKPFGQLKSCVNHMKTCASASSSRTSHATPPVPRGLG